MAKCYTVGNVRIWRGFLSGDYRPHLTAVSVHIPGAGWQLVRQEHYTRPEEADARWQELLDGFRAGKFTIVHHEGYPRFAVVQQRTREAKLLRIYGVATPKPIAFRWVKASEEEYDDYLYWRKYVEPFTSKEVTK